ncbi:amidohydrolase family protein [uncultured Desulfosarcina sp.]|uniref:amidohydrolase family protein n=1 Tax=uncultured Desulfosarcina sp. TaxID=218289 RepID=UPI0029C679A7|nr:amidohydrolase family protein [uncultured Desulfosarcina sp.]
MSKSKRSKNDCDHPIGCGCAPTLFVNMMEDAGRELSRRQFIRGVGVAGGMLAFGSLLPSCSDSKPLKEGANADVIYHGGPILTMVKDGDRAEALAVQNGKILAVGTMTEIMTSKGSDTKVIDLGGKTLMPGFFDPHSHLVMQSAKFSTANLDPKPIGEAGSIADIQHILKERIEEKKKKPGEWVIGWGYDDTGIEEQRHPNRDDLDAVSTEHPILLMHISGHLMTGNSRMIEELGLTADSKDPDGGVIQRRPGSREPNGVLEENAMYLVLAKLPMPTPEQAMEMIEEGLQFYAEAGITTAQDCATFKGTWQLLAAMEQKGQLPIDVITWPMYKGIDDESFDYIVKNRNSRGRLRLGGVKLTVDGSIQGYTAFLSKPYHVQPDNAHPIPDKCDSEQAERIFISPENETYNPDLPLSADEGHRGYASMTQDQIDKWVKRCDENGIQLQVHTNGDGATDMLIKAVEKVRADKPRPDLRTTIIHAQTMREDQLDFSAKHGLTPSFFPIHVYFWGDRHRDLFIGPERAAMMNPSRSALDRNLKVTLHHDAPIAGIEMLKVAWAAVNRVTTSGKLLGPEERITPFEALRAITADAAWQNFEEDRKGTLEKGKLADLVVLSDDPLGVDPIAIKNIRVVQTIKEGETVYLAKT